MSMPKKGTKKIVADGVTYRWRVSRWRRVSDWKPADLENLDAEWLERARQFGLGEMADVVFRVPIELHESPSSQLLVKYFAKVVDGFFGPEQFTQIRPSFVRRVIESARAAGWDPAGHRHMTIEVVESSDAPLKPVLLILPHWKNIHPIPGYDREVQLIPLFRKDVVADETAAEKPSDEE
jgi:hypothetical protein